MSDPRPRKRESGFTVVEMLVALLLAGWLLGAAFKMLIEDSRAYHSQMQIAEMRQNARSALEFVTRDVMPVGYGILGHRDYEVPVLIANEPTVLDAASTSAITVRHNQSDVSTTLSAPMTDPSANVAVTTVGGFAVGQRVLIWDETGSFDWLAVTAVQASPAQLQHSTDACSKAYDPAENAWIAAINEIAFRYDAATMQLQRQQDAGPWIPIAANVESFALRYWDKNDVQLFPATDADRLKVRKIAVDLRVRTAQKDRTTGKYKTYSVSTEMTPRNLQTIPDDAG